MNTFFGSLAIDRLDTADEKVSELRLALDAKYTAAEKVAELGLSHTVNVYRR